MKLEIKKFYSKRKLIELKNFLSLKWKKIDKTFWKRIEEITNVPWKFNKYVCFINNVTIGHYLIPNEIRISEKNPYTIAEELFHLHYWYIWKKLFKINERHPQKLNICGKKWSIWHVSETIVEFVLLKDKILKRFWKVNREASYPWLPKIRKILYPLWIKRKNFNSFLLDAHKACGIKI